MQLPLMRSIGRVPGGMMIVPLIIGAVIVTVAPHTATSFGSFTGALFTGALTILAVFYVCMGSTISVGMLLGNLDRELRRFIDQTATVLIASSVIVSSLLTPVATAWWAHRVKPVPAMAGR